MMVCSNCHTEIYQGAQFCGNCGAQIMLAPLPQQPAPVGVDPQLVGNGATLPPNSTDIPTNAQPNFPPVPTMSGATSMPESVTAPIQAQGTYPIPKQENTGMSIASMVLGIIALLLSWLLIISFPLAILALILGFIGRDKGGKGMALAGIITAGIAIPLSIVITIWIAGDVEALEILNITYLFSLK
jgi:hypothetical protein